VALVAAAGASALAQDGSAAITDIRQESSDRSTRLVVEMNSALAYTYYSPDPLTLVVDVPGVDASAVPARINVGSREVESLRVTQMARGDGRSLARIEVRLASLVPYQIYSRDKSLHLVFERGERAAAAVPAAAPAPAVATAAPVEPTPQVAEAPAEAPAPAPAATQAPEPTLRPRGPRASRILGVTPSTEGDQFELTVRADGTLQYQDFFLGNPDRLVIDLRDVSTRAPYRAEVGGDAVRSVRLAQFSAGSPKIARLVLDLAERKPYHIVEANDGLKVVFGEGRTPAPAPLAALKPEPEPEPQPEQIADAALPAPAPAPRSIAPVPAVVVPQAPVATAASEPSGDEVKRWSGHPITFDFKDGDLQDIFRLFADISGLNVVVNPGISGKVTLKLTEVPWDQALDLILKINSLGYTIEDNVLRIARVADLQREESDRRKLAEEKALAGELTDWTRRVYYAKAAELSETIRKAGALSARGQLNVDPRTNTLLMRDLPQYVEKAKSLIGELDIATPQVEIEARIVVTSRNFTRDLGIQWGFNQVQSPTYGNTTNQIFPNSMVINGQGVPAAGGLTPTQIQGTEQIGQVGRGYAVNMPASGFNSAIGVSMGNILGNFNLDAALTALERQGRGRLLSTPKVTTQNNMAAEIKQGIQIPIQTVANNTVTVTFKDAVLTLKVTPQISEAGTVILSVEVENNNPDFANLVNGIPPINTQSARTNVLVRDGSTAVIGGIYQSQEQSRQDSTPFLGKLPILGYLFKNKFTTSSNNELLLFITPRIIKS